MTAILAIFSSDGQSTDDAIVNRMLVRMAHRGGPSAGVWRGPGVTLAVSRKDWEMDPERSGSTLVLNDGDVVVAADASVYYRDDLRRKLSARGVSPKGETPSHLILAAYEAFGATCAEFLEGDFSFVLWDQKKRLVIAARDFTATRPLFFTERQGTLIVASSIDAVLAHPHCTSELDLVSIAADAAGLLFATGDQTAYRDVRRLNGGTTLVRSESGCRVTTHWQPTAPIREPASSLDEGADELRALLADAVAERLDRRLPTSVWLSGGWDSTAVFAMGQKLLLERGKSDGLRPVSMALPADDPWCETARTASVGTHWGVPIRWLDSERIPLLVDPDKSACERPEPWSHEYEQMVRALAGGSRQDGARVALNGHGGDFLFYGSPVFLADLLSKGRLLQAAREWRAMPVRKPRTFFDYALQPLLPTSALRLAEMLRNGRPIPTYAERPIPFWFDRSFIKASGLDERARAAVPTKAKGISRSASEMQWVLRQIHGERVVSTTAGFALDSGIETRLPLLDRRLVQFALSRPWWERRSSGEDKHLIRHAMRDMLPPTVLAPRPLKTGSLGGYFGRALQRSLPDLLDLTKTSLLAEYGIVDPVRLQHAASVCRRSLHSDKATGVRLLATLQAELWLRAHSRRARESNTEIVAGRVA